MLARCCDIWTNGIYWENDEVEAIVEVTENYRCVTVITSMIDIQKGRDVFNKVIKTILKLIEMHAFKCEEYQIAPSDVAKARSLLVNERTLYHISNIAHSVLKKCIVTDDSNTKKVGIEQIVGADDPFFCIAPSVTKALFNAEVQLREDLLQHIVYRCSYFSSSILSSSHTSVKEHCSKLSVFAERNPLVSIN